MEPNTPGNTPYADLQEENFIPCDYVWDFFLSPLVKRALWDTWNLCNINELKNPRDFDITQASHLWFIRTIWEVPELEKEFLNALRKRTLQLRNIDRFKYNCAQIIAFILLWEDIQSRICNSTEGLSSMFQKKAGDIIMNLKDKPAYATQKEKNWEITYITKSVALFNLATKGFPVIDETGAIIYWLKDDTEFSNFFHVINDNEDVSIINENGHRLSDDIVHQYEKEGIIRKLEFYDECLQFTHGSKEKLYATQERINKEIVSLDLSSTWDDLKNKELIISRLESERENLYQYLRELCSLDEKAKLQLIVGWKK